MVPDEQDQIEAALIDMSDAKNVLILTTGGTGPAERCHS